MKYAPQVIVILVIIFGWFWLGMEWGWSTTREAPRNSVTPEIPQPPTKIIPVIVPAEEKEEEIPPTTTVVEETPVEPEAPAPQIVVNTTIDSNLPTKISDTMNHYSNSSFWYEFDIPANVYYAWFGASDGARHTVGISKEDPENLTDAAIRVYYYGKKIVPELQNVSNNKYEDPAGKYIYLLLDGAYSVKIEASNINNPIVQKVIETIQVF